MAEIWQFSFYLIPILIAAALSGFFSWRVWKKRPAAGTEPLFLLNISIAFWSLCYAVELALINLPAKIFWMRLEYFGIVTLPIFWLFFSMQYTQPGKALPEKTTPLLFIIPLITLGLVFTNQNHQLIWSSISLQIKHNLTTLRVSYGPWFWLHTVYSYTLFLIGFYFLVRYYFKLKKPQNRQVGAILLAALIPILGNFLYLSGLNPFPGIDLTSLSFSLTGIIIIRILFFQDFLNIIPIAREVSFENMTDGVLVINRDGLVADHNPAIEAILKKSGEDLNLQQGELLLASFFDWNQFSNSTTIQNLTAQINNHEQGATYDIRISPLFDKDNQHQGHLVVFHDITETTRLHKDLQNQANRLSVLYEVGKAINSTLEIDDVLELIYEQLAEVIPSDSYFVAIYLPEEHALDIRLIIDQGNRYPPQKISADQGISSWIVKYKQTLLISNLKDELDSLPVKPILVGENQLSSSWLGVPLLSEDKLLGILAVTSYQADAFTKQDQLLLEQIAQQAALSIENARQHKKVELQARLDSLTGVSNHSHFIQVLYQEAKLAADQKKPLSLIMLDIDYFKQYNDTYGHILGDQVLKLTVQAIESHIKKSDTVGRWGGEEFGIILPNTTIVQANMVANRIRHTLSKLPLFDTDGKPIPKPTISQGIANLPEHTENVDELVVIADRALYRAKEKGRDQVALGIPSSV